MEFIEQGIVTIVCDGSIFKLDKPSENCYMI